LKENPVDVIAESKSAKQRPFAKAFIVVLADLHSRLFALAMAGPWPGWKFITLGRQRYNKMYVGCMQILEFHSFF
jgi:hypothetical protein